MPDHRAGATLRPGRCPCATFGDQRNGARLEHAVTPDNSVAAAMFAGAAGPAPHGIFVNHDRITALQRFNRRVARVAHADVHTTWSRPFSARALAAAECFIKRPSGTAKGDVVHRALPLRRHGNTGVGERGKEEIAHPLRRLDISGGDRRWPMRIEKTIRRHRNRDRTGNAFVRRHLVVEQCPQYEQRRRPRDGDRAIHIAAHAWRCAGEIKTDRTGIDRDLHLEGNWCVTEAVAFQNIFGVAGDVADFQKPGTGATRRVVEQRIAGGGDTLAAFAFQ